MFTSQGKTLSDQYTAVDQAFSDALLAIRQSGRPDQERRELYQRLEGAHRAGDDAPSQLAAIEAFMTELKG